MLAFNCGRPIAGVVSGVGVERELNPHAQLIVAGRVRDAGGSDQASRRPVLTTLPLAPLCTSWNRRPRRPLPAFPATAFRPLLPRRGVRRPLDDDTGSVGHTTAQHIRNSDNFTFGTSVPAMGRNAQ
jgi:hypothetical protein